MFGYVCTIHPGMRGNIEVREASATLTETPDQAIQRGQLTRSALLGKIQADVQTVKGMNVGNIHTAASGVGNTFGVSANVFAPGNVTVKRGDSVVWYWPDPFNVHTVTFSSGAAPPDLIQPRGPQTLVFPANVASPTGGTTYTGQGYLNSGLLFGNASFAATIDAPPGTYTYYCIIHGSPEGGMRGTITVTG
jgi:plastocyanin